MLSSHFVLVYGSAISKKSTSNYKNCQVINLKIHAMTKEMKAVEGTLLIGGGI